MGSCKNCCPFVTKLCAVTKLGDLTVVFCWHLEGQCRKQQDPDPGSGSRIRIHQSGAWIRGSGSTPKCHGSATLFYLNLKLPFPVNIYRAFNRWPLNSDQTNAVFRVRIGVGAVPNPALYLEADLQQIRILIQLWIRIFGYNGSNRSGVFCPGIFQTL